MAAPADQLGPPTATSLSASTDLQLEVIRNGEDTGLIAAFTQRPDGRFLIAPSELKALGLVAPNTTEPVLLDGLDGVQYRYDDVRQQMFIQARPQALLPTLISFRARHETAPLSHDVGALLNYSLSLTAGVKAPPGRFAFDGVEGAFEARAFGPFGLVTSGFDLGASSDGGNAVRLDTTWTYSDEKSLVTARAGDFISDGFSWTRPIHMAGFQIGRDFALRPDMITVPTPVLSATAAAPSTLDVLLGSQTILSRQIPEGPVQISDLPVLQGQGQARLVLRDALGGEQQIVASYFAAPELLAPKMFDFSVEAGFARRNFGLLSNDYLKTPLVSGSARYGLSENLTLQGHTEDGDGVINLSGGVAARIGDIGVASLALAGSQYQGRPGGLFAVTFLTHMSDATLSAQFQRTEGAYRDLATVSAHQTWLWNGLQMGLPPKSLMQLTGSAPLKLAFLDHNGDVPTMSVSYSTVTDGAGPSRAVLNASVQYRIASRVSLQLSLYASHAATTADNGFFVALSFPLGRARDGQAGVENASGETKPFAEASQQDRPDIGSTSWRVHVDGGASPDVEADGSYRASFGRLSTLATYVGGVAQVQGRMDGAIAWMGRPLLAPDRIDGAFAAIDVGAPHVEVTQQGRPIGFSDTGGWILASNLLPYQANRLDIDVEALSLDFATQQTHLLINPPSGAGALVRFGVTAAPSQARVNLKLDDGRYVPAGDLASLNGGEAAIVVGYDGEIFLPELTAQTVIRVDLGDDNACVARLSVDLTSKARLHVAQLVCHSTTPHPVAVAHAAAAVSGAPG